MTHKNDPSPTFERDSLRVVIGLSSACDVQAISSALALSGMEAYSPPSILPVLGRGAGVLLVSGEVFKGQALTQLADLLAEQPSWSHLPIVVLLDPGESFASTHPEILRLEALGSVTFLEGPARLSTLVSTVRSSLAYRKRQYQQRDLLAQLEQSRREALEANRAKSDFLANISHEIRTPLGAVMGFSELMMEAGVNEREKMVYMTTIRRNGQLLSALIDDLLDLARIEGDQLECQNLEFSLVELMADVVDSLGSASRVKNLGLFFDPLPAGSDIVRGDPVRIKQILLNVIGNAIKFTAVGAVRVRTALPGSESNLHGSTIFEIEDTGIGIAPVQQNCLFRAFSQADTSSTRRFGGTGLGLVLSRKLARAMGGDLTLKWSQLGEGSCFRLEIPLEQTGGSRAEFGGVPARVPEAGRPLEGCRVLVVDDSIDNQTFLGRTLNGLGAHIALASDGLEAVRMANAAAFDMVFMDLQMPRLGGVEATKILRDNGYTQPIVALAAPGIRQDRTACINVGCDEYLTKPIQRQDLVAVFKKMAVNPARSCSTPPP